SQGRAQAPVNGLRVTTISSRGPVFPTGIHSLSTSCEQRAVVPQDHARRIVAGRAGDAAAGMGAGAAVIETLQRAAIVGMSEHRPCREQLVQGQRAMED